MAHDDASVAADETEEARPHCRWSVVRILRIAWAPRTTFVCATASSALGVGWLLATAPPNIAVVSVLAVVGLVGVIAWPRRRLTTSQTALSTALLLYLVPLLMFGRAYGTVGISPIYLPDVLIGLGTVVMLPRARLRDVRPFPVMALAIAALAAYSVYVGRQNGYPYATKGVVLALYPVIAAAVAGWLAADSAPDQLLSVLPRFALPLIPVGLATLMLTHTPLIAAAAGLYLGTAASFATVPKMCNRKLLAISVTAGVILLVGLNAKRGPALAILASIMVSWVASRAFRKDLSSATSILALGTIVAALAIAFSVGLASPTQVPVAGNLASRALGTEGSGERVQVAAANNVYIRQAMWAYALHAADSNPLLGVGAYHPIEVNYKGYDLSQETATGPHNSFVAYAFYAGYPAALLVVLAFALAFTRLWRVRRQSLYAPALLGALTAVVITALTNVAFETTYIGGPSWLVLGGALGLSAHLSSHSITRSEASGPPPIAQI